VKLNVYAVLLKPLPFQHPGQLVFLSEAKPQNGISSAGASYDNFTEIRVQNKVFSELAGITTHELTFTGHGEPALVDIAGITPELFSLLGTKPLLGRLFIADDGKQGAVALGDDMHFSSSPRVSKINTNFLDSGSLRARCVSQLQLFRRKVCGAPLAAFGPERASCEARPALAVSDSRAPLLQARQPKEGLG
jgi:hypothetical protein